MPPSRWVLTNTFPKYYKPSVGLDEWRSRSWVCFIYVILKSKLVFNDDNDRHWTIKYFSFDFESNTGKNIGSVHFQPYPNKKKKKSETILHKEQKN